jgi:hypothetical protein
MTSSTTPSTQTPPLSINYGSQDCETLIQKRNECYRKQQQQTSSTLHGTKNGDNDDGKRRQEQRHHPAAGTSWNIHHPSNKKCWIPTLKAKRCLAFVYCPRQAVAFYGTPTDGHDHDNDRHLIKKNTGGSSSSTTNTTNTTINTITTGGIQKGMCASFDEAYCFGNPQQMKIDTGSGDGDGNGGRTDEKVKRRQQRQRNIFEHHQKSIRKVGNNIQKWKECQDIKRILDQCLREQ